MPHPSTRRTKTHQLRGAKAALFQDTRKGFKCTWSGTRIVPRIKTELPKPLNSCLWSVSNHGRQIRRKKGHEGRNRVIFVDLAATDPRISRGCRVWPRAVPRVADPQPVSS